MTSTVIPIAYAPGSEEREKQILEELARDLLSDSNHHSKALVDIYFQSNRKYMYGMCRYAQIHNDVILTLTSIENNLQLALTQRYINDDEALQIKVKLCKIFHGVNKFAQDHLETSTDSTPRTVRNKNKLTCDEDLHEKIFRPITEEFIELNDVIQNSFHAPEAQTLCAGITNAASFLFRNLIFGTIAVALTTVAYGLAKCFALCCCFPPEVSPTNFKRSIFKAWGNDHGVMRCDLQDANKNLSQKMYKGTSDWLFGHFTGNRVTNAPRNKSPVECSHHISNKKWLFNN
jgi:hypothetical protein